MKRLTIITTAVIFSHTLSAQVNFNNNTVNAANYSSALGEENNSTGLSSLAIGKHDTVTGDYSFAGGINSSANGGVSFAFGANCISDGPYSVTLGHSIEAYGLQSMVIGTGAGNEEPELLINNISQSLMIGFGSEKPTLFVGPSGPGHTGKIGIGEITAPESKLHIKADDNEPAELFIQPNVWGGDNTAYLWLGTKEYGLKAAYNRLEFKTSAGGKYNFIDGNVGIGTYNPSEKLEVAGKIKTTGFQLVDGLQGEGKYLRSDADGNASWEASTISNFECLASGLYASAIGKWDTASGDYSFAGGVNSKAEGPLSFAFGSNTRTSGTHSIAIGVGSNAQGGSSFALGKFCSSEGNNSITMGGGQSSTQMLTNTVDNSLMIGFNGYSTFFVAPSYGGHSGRVGIGDVMDPQAKLHIKGDENEQAVVFIEPYVFGGSYVSELWIGTPDYGLKSTWGRLHFNTGGNYIFNSPNANVGIGTSNPLTKLQVNGNVFIDDENSGLILKSPDGQCWKIMVSNNGELTTTSINCDLTTGEAEFNQPQKEIIRIYPNPTENKITIENTFTSPVFVMVRDINGMLLITQKLQPGDNGINLENMATGYFLVTILNNENQVITSEKIMKK